MTEPQTPEPPHLSGTDPDGGYEPASPGMPRWVPVLIGGLLVVLAGLAVFTGLRYRDSNTMSEHVQPRREKSQVFAPPGEPDAGASRVMHGEADVTPNANAPVTGQARAVITGGPGGVQTTVRIWARRGMVLEVTPPEAMVYVNGLLIGHANQFDTTDEIYDFAEPGSYTVRIVAPSGTEKTFIVTAATEAEQDVARIEAKL
ncbi:MAG TPA: hypothetical protein VE974_04350 [Thermoanaerobaculia bacterium]|nr:hypothetical protein [Thermoanaerobaculia bacterium]